MTPYKELHVVIRQNSYELSKCAVLCPRNGENDYGPPFALILPTTEIISLSAANIIDKGSQKVETDEIDWNDEPH